MLTETTVQYSIPRRNGYREVQGKLKRSEYFPFAMRPQHSTRRNLGGNFDRSFRRHQMTRVRDDYNTQQHSHPHKNSHQAAWTEVCSPRGRKSCHLHAISGGTQPELRNSVLSKTSNVQLHRRLGTIGVIALEFKTRECDGRKLEALQEGRMKSIAGTCDRGNEPKTKESTRSFRNPQSMFHSIIQG